MGAEDLAGGEARRHLDQPVRWAVIGTANIARVNFVPALSMAGGVVSVVGSRTEKRARWFMDAAQIQADWCGYGEAMARDDVDAVYIATPNTLHFDLTKAALELGKPVLCEKPLGCTPEETNEICQTAAAVGQPLWEAFAFPFHNQWRRLERLIAGGEIGELREIHSNFHFEVRQEENIRWDASLAGGALNDVGCYPIHLARLLYGHEPVATVAVMRPGGRGVDAECQAILDFGQGRRLAFSCGLARWRDTSTRLLGTAGEVRLSDPYHPTQSASLTVIRDGVGETLHLVDDEPSFTPMLRSICAAVAHEGPKEHIAGDDAPGTARALDLVRRSFVQWG